MTALDWINRRVCIDGHVGTVRFAGQLPGKGEQVMWLGVEWDDAERGKHNGIFQGVQYFQCR
jgi:dynactin complex subunit